MDDDGIDRIVVDVGSFSVKAGFCGDDSSPHHVLPNVLGRERKNPVTMQSWMNCSVWVGDEAMARRGILELTKPVVDGVVQNFDDWERVLQHMLRYVLRVAPEEHPVLITTSENETQREKMCQIAFETFNVPALYLAYRSPLALFANGRTAGTVWRCGDSHGSAVAVYEGYHIPHSRVSNSVNGGMLTEHLMKTLSKKKGYSFTTTAEREIVRDIKEKLCYVSMDAYEEGANTTNSKDYELPDGQIITVDVERYMVPESLFQTKVLNGKQNEIWNDDTEKAILECKNDKNNLFSKLPKDLMTKLLDMRYEPYYSPPTQIMKCVESCDEEMRCDLYEAIVLAGGTSMFPGLPERIQEEVKTRSKAGKVKVVAPPERKYSTWIGGNFLSSLSTFPEFAGSKAEYDEWGPRLAKVKFF